MSAPTYALSQYPPQVLSPLMGNSNFVASGPDFISFSSTVTIPEGCILVSSDVVSVYTNIPVELAISVVEKRLDEVDLSDTPP